MQAILSVQTVNKWATDFVNEMNTICAKNEWLRKKLSQPVPLHKSN